jgi:hypothetical protein
LMKACKQGMPPRHDFLLLSSLLLGQVV